VYDEVQLGPINNIDRQHNSMTSAKQPHQGQAMQFKDLNRTMSLFRLLLPKHGDGHVKRMSRMMLLQIVTAQQRQRLKMA
jgi:hypothetical protein